jgi:drug/metabolite transporter (DMT)-like permease
MTRRGLALLVISALCTVAANLLLRGGILLAGGFVLSLDRIKDQFLGLVRQPMFVAGFLLYGVAALVWFRVLSTEDLSVSYPLLVSLTFVLVTLGAAFFFHEQLSWRKVFGISIILVGFLLTVRA